MSSAAAFVPESTHLVRFYNAADELVDAVAHHVLDGSSGAAVIVATEAHRALIEGRIAEMGGGPRRSTQAIVMLDADQTLHRFFDGVRIDPVRFDEVIGGLIRAHARPGHPIRVYGEMVAVLWDAGQVTAALELEDLWNDLAATVDFSLLCGYPRHSTLAGDDAIRRVCDAHGSVLGRPEVVTHAEASQAFARSAATPAVARSFIRATLREWHADEQLDDIVLVADELVTNAVVHGNSDVVVTLTANADSVRVAVADRSPVPPRPANRGAAAMSGRGLHIVDILASAWGHQRCNSGKVVWARFDS